VAVVIVFSWLRAWVFDASVLFGLSVVKDA
jgi:hypothetical protein